MECLSGGWFGSVYFYGLNQIDDLIVYGNISLNTLMKVCTSPIILYVHIADVTTHHHNFNTNTYN